MAFSIEDKFVSLSEAAEFFGVSTKTLRRMIEAKDIPAIRVGGHTRGPIRVRISDIMDASYKMGKTA